MTVQVDASTKSSKKNLIATVNDTQADESVSSNFWTTHFSFDGFDGPLDLLLELARKEEIEISKVPILPVIEQFLAVAEGRRISDLASAAEWILMIAKLIWLRSKLVVPQDKQTKEAQDEAEDLKSKLEELAFIRLAAAWLSEQPQLGYDVFHRPPEMNKVEFKEGPLKITLFEVEKAWASIQYRMKQRQKKRSYKPRPPMIWTVQDALSKLGKVLAKNNFDKQNLFDVVPDLKHNPVEYKAAIASTLIAGLEMTKIGETTLDQDHMFSPISIQRRQTVDKDA